MEKLSVFLVEDSDIVAESMVELLEGTLPVNVVHVARTEDDAVKWLEKNSADVSIIDVKLDSGNGISVLKRGLPYKQGTWIIFSAFNKIELYDMCRANGADWVFDKSNEIGSLIQLLTKLSNNVPLGK